VDVGIGMEVDVRVDVEDVIEDEVESSDRGNKELINQRVAKVLAAYEANLAAELAVESQSQKGDDYDNENIGRNGNRNGEGNGDRNGGGNGNKNEGGNGNPNRNDRGVIPITYECTFHDFVKCQPLNFKGTKGFVRLTDGLRRWRHCFTSSVVKRCNMLRNIITAEPMRLQDAICIANNLMDQKLKGYAVKNAENKRRDYMNNVAATTTQRAPVVNQRVFTYFECGRQGCCTLGLLGYAFNIDLMPIELGSFGVIIGMDWSANLHAEKIVCDEKIIQIPYGNEVLIVQGDRSGKEKKSKLSIISCTKTQKYIKKGCHIFLAQVTKKETKDKSEEKRLEDMPIVRDFLEVFPEDLP
nr:reverse transcriptase domain-containing protein [Tanacetum cinerariifolium]